MDHATTPLTNPSYDIALRHSACRSLIAAFAALLAVLAATGAEPLHAVPTLASFALTSALVWRSLDAHAPHPRFGPANLVTLGRAAGVCVLVGLLPSPAPALAAQWAIAATAFLLIAADGLDGWLARRGGVTSAFGARFDMETDAALILVMAALLVQQDRIGAWILASGLLRPAFILAGRAYPPLAGALPPRQRRRTIAVVQGLSLAIALMPALGPGPASISAGIGLAAAAWSFGIDSVWLLRYREGRA